MQQLFVVSVLVFSNNILSEPSADITLNLNINTNTNKGKSEKESVALVRDNENSGALGRSLKRKINIYIGIKWHPIIKDLLGINIV